MKKIVAMGAAAALLSGIVFAGEPASNPSVVSFNGNASVEWGVDLDAGKTGFSNGTWAEFKAKLFDAGTKELSSENDIWAELKIKADDQDSVGSYGNNNGTVKAQKAAVDTAKLHFGNVYVGIMAGDTKTGELDLSTAVKSGDPWFHPGRWLDAVGAKVLKEIDKDGKPVYTEYTKGIVAGYEDGNLNVAVDFRSLDWGQYTNAYALSAEVGLKDSNEWLNGLAAKAGVSYDLSDVYFTESKTGDVAKEVKKPEHTLGYSASAGYKLAIDDTYYVKPMVGITGTYSFSEKDKVKSSEVANVIAGSVLFGWGATNSYGSTGQLYFFDDDYGDKAKGLTPGLSVVAKVPLATVGKQTSEGKTFTKTTHDAIIAQIVPSVYLGDSLVPGLKLAAYSEIALYNGKKDAKLTETSTETWNTAKDVDNTMAMALVAGLSYDVKVDAITVTPKASVRYANACYMDNDTKSKIPAADKTMFNDMGIQKKKTEAGKTDLYDGDFFNLKASVNVAGLIDNTDFYLNYTSANLLNGTEYKDPTYNVKAGTFNVGCKIHF